MAEGKKTPTVSYNSTFSNYQHCNLIRDVKRRPIFVGC